MNELYLYINGESVGIIRSSNTRLFMGKRIDTYRIGRIGNLALGAILALVGVKVNVMIYATDSVRKYVRIEWKGLLEEVVSSDGQTGSASITITSNDQPKTTEGEMVKTYKGEPV